MRLVSTLLPLLLAAPCHAFSPPPRTSTTSHPTSTTRLHAKRGVASLLDWAKQTADIQVANPLSLESIANAGLGWKIKTNDATPNAVVMSVPSSVALTVQVPGEGPDDASVRKIVPDRKLLDDLPWFVVMSLYLHKLDKVSSVKSNENLDMRPWLDSLPRQFDTPIHWQATSLQELQYDFLVEAVKRQETTWKQWYDKLNVPNLSYDDFVWGCECARSRAFSGTGAASFNPLIYAFTLLLVTVYIGLHLGTVEQAANGAGVVLSLNILKDFVVPKLLKRKRYVICPMIDMTNHKSLPNAQVSLEYFQNSYSLAISSPIKAGDEVYISYGARSNDQFLQYYGFCEPDNPSDVYIMPPLREWNIEALEQACGRTFASGRLAKLDRAGLLGTSSAATASDLSDNDDGVANRSGGVVITRAGGIDPAVLQALRALVSNDAEWQAAGEAIGNFSEEGSGGSANEEAARKAAKKALELELASKPTTIEQDREILKRMNSAMKSVDSSPEEKLAVTFRIEKKKLLQETIDKL